MSKSLSMTFATDAGNKASISVNNVKENVTTDEVKGLMDTIIEKKAFKLPKGALVSKSSAEIIERNVDKITL
ncbi:DUF2922 domain-containing protein [Inconstantimicrobium mannanitabidum]|uniref:Uncharacterized protein n=1 Tax=Inconstantimicrobium mannanitabidum TaxID=1604901 RepID=A0ACB5RIQ4_9CLOT|nr:DUF2922 domain-containing protein [Clostridium sp. TW13]GKX68973.1 hypothetical protein rsdtw13_42310 [Clostridium sp. TW13]